MAQVQTTSLDTDNVCSILGLAVMLQSRGNPDEFLLHSQSTIQPFPGGTEDTSACQDTLVVPAVDHNVPFSPG